MASKKAILLVIDAITSRVVGPALQAGRLPNMQRLAQRGVWRSQCTSVFPSITPAATCSIATGEYPRRHAVCGNFWYEAETDRVLYYGDDIWVVLNQGLGKYFRDYVIRLNHQQLDCNTIFQAVERRGLDAGCINYMWIRGDHEQRINAPLLLKLLPNVKFAATVSGPKVLFCGDFIKSPIAEKTPDTPGGLRRRFGFHDDATTAYLLALARNKLPDFTLAYFPNNDFESHARGPQAALDVLQKVDATLGELIETLGGMDQALRQHAIIITGDHSQSDLVEDSVQRGIRLEQLLDGYRLVDAGGKWKKKDDLMVCPNMRAVHLYFKKWLPEQRDRLVVRLLADERVDQVIWDNRMGQLTGDRFRRWHVSTRDRGRIEFWLQEDHDTREADNVAADQYGNRWAWNGSLAAVDGSIDAQGLLQFEKYPNAFERIAGGLGDNGGDLWATSHIGYEFRMREVTVHNRGSHGSLHQLDSSCPLIVAGHSTEITIPDQPRAVDIYPLCMAILGLEHESFNLAHARRLSRWESPPIASS